MKVVIRVAKKEKSFLDKIKLEFDKIVLVKILLTALFLILGIIIYQNSLLTAQVVGISIGIYFLVSGIFSIYEFLIRGTTPLFGYRILFGILFIILGFVTIINPFGTMRVLTIGLGIYLILKSICKIIDAINFKKYGFDGWFITLAISIIILIFGILTVVDPLASLELIQVVGIFIILSCILEICNLIVLHNRTKEIIKLFKEKK